MTKAELITRIIDCMTDPYTDCAEDYLYSDPISLETAEEYLRECRQTEIDNEYAPDECLPAETTPELLMTAYNCWIRKQKHEARVDRLTGWIADSENVCLHNHYFRDYPNDDPEVLPTDFLFSDTFPFPTKDGRQPDVIDLIRYGYKSGPAFFESDGCYTWFDAEEEVLHSSDTPFADGIINARALAEFALSPEGSECLTEVLAEMDEDEIGYVFGCSESDLLAELS